MRARRFPTKSIRFRRVSNSKHDGREGCPDVRFGSITDIEDGWRNVRFTSKSRHCYAVVMLAGLVGSARPPDPYDAQSGVKVYVDV